MNDVESRLEKCFGAVFRNLTSEEIASATMERVPDWDSSATVMLVSVIEEEFGMQIELDAIESLLSFSSASLPAFFKLVARTKNQKTTFPTSRRQNFQLL